MRTSSDSISLKPSKQDRKPRGKAVQEKLLRSTGLGLQLPLMVCASPSTVQEATAAVATLATELGFEYFQLLARFKHSDFKLATATLSNHPSEWLNQYQRNSWAASDPVLEAARSAVMPFGLDTVKASDAVGKYILGTARQFGLDQGLAIPFHGPDGESLTLVLSGGESGNNQESSESIHHHCWDFLARHFTSLSTLFKPAPKTSKGNKLSRREIQVLQLLANGRPLKVIATCLNISLRTVNITLKKAARKLGVVTREQAMACALTTGQITYMCSNKEEGIEFLSGS